MIPNLSLSASAPKHLYTIKLNDLSTVEGMGRWLPDSQESDEAEDYMETTAVECIQTSTHLQLMYLALISVAVEEGVSKKDRFIKNSRFLPIAQLYEITASGEPEKKNQFDTLGNLLELSYKKITVLFRYRMQNLESNFQYFWFFRSVFISCLHLLQYYSRDEFTKLHTKSLLTLLLKQKDATTLMREFKKQSTTFM